MQKFGHTSKTALPYLHIPLNGGRVFKGRVKKKWWKIPPRGGGAGTADSRKKQNKKHVLNYWILHNNHFKTHFFFFNFWVGGTLFSTDPGLKSGSNLKAQWKGPNLHKLFI